MLYESIRLTTEPGHVIYGATSASSLFNITYPNIRAIGADQIEHGQGFTMTVGSESYIFTASSAANEPCSGRFNSLSSLADAINQMHI